MSADSQQFAAADGRTSLHLLVEEADRQLRICNACRYCEGLCAVFPALERRTVLDGGDISQLANLCHDCRSCYDACMYTAPHEFAINIPRALSDVRLEDYRGLVWPRRVPALLQGWSGVFSGGVIAVLVVLLVATAHVGFSGLIRDSDGPASPYQLIPYGVLLVLLFIPTVFAFAVFAAAGVTYWRRVGGASKRLSWSAVAKAVGYAATLRYLRGGGQDCYYPEDTVPSPARRHLHALVAYGFGLCFLSTIVAAVMQDIIGQNPPYPVLSVPVMSGIVGGVGIVIGTIGLLRLKMHSSQVTSVREMTIKDYGLLVALAFLALSGLATLAARSTPAFGLIFLVHLAAICLTFAAAPYSKFIHVLFRFLALVRDNFERAETDPDVGLSVDSARPPRSGLRSRAGARTAESGRGAAPYASRRALRQRHSEVSGTEGNGRGRGRTGRLPTARGRRRGGGLPRCPGAGWRTGRRVGLP